MDSDIITKAQDGDSFAQLDLGKMYYNAYLMDDNCALAFKWISLSAEQGNMEAQFILGNLYALGQGTKQSHIYAYEWYTKSALQGYSKALIRIHNLYEDDKYMHCRGYQDRNEKREFPINYLPKEKARDTREYRLLQSGLILNKSMEYYHQTFSNYKKQDTHDERALTNMGFMYQHGYGVKRNIKQAIEHYTAAADKNVIDAQYNLGNIYQQRQDIKDNDKIAFMWYSKAAENGNTVAQNCLGYLYEKGIGIENNSLKALYWYTQAANKRCNSSQLNLARIYRTGQGAAQDYNESMMWYKLAAAEGSLVAQNCLDQLCSIEEIIRKSESTFSFDYYKDPIDRRRIRSLLRKHVSQVENTKTEKILKKIAMNAMRGDINAMYEISIKYRDGIDLSQDSDLSFKWLKKSAKGGLLIAQGEIGKVYHDGDLVKQNYYKSSIWFKRGSTQKDNEIQCKLGEMYLQGLGVRRDALEANKRFTKSVENNNGEAQYYLGFTSLYGQGVRKNRTEGLKWLIMSAKQRNDIAMETIGSYYDGNRDGQRDLPKAITWYMRAAKLGSQDSQFRLISLYNDHKDLLTDIASLKCFTEEPELDISDPHLAYCLVDCYLQGKIVKKDYVKAFHLLKKAEKKFSDFKTSLLTVPVRTLSTIDCNCLLNMYTLVTQNGIDNMEYNIGYMYEFGIRNNLTFVQLFKSSIPDCIKWYIAATKKGIPQAQYRLGVIYEKGKGTGKKPVAAADFYTKAAEKGIPDAMFRLACLYLKGCGVSQDLEKAFNLFTQSHNMDQHHTSRFLKIPRDVTKNRWNVTEHDIKVPPDDYEENEIEYESNKEVYDLLSMEMLETVAGRGNVAVQYKLGCLYSTTESTDYNYSKAVYWLTLASQQEIPDACYRLGVLYENSVEKIYSKAKILYQKATEEKHDEALYRLAHLYLYGKGVLVDYQKAFDLFTEAAKQENIRAQKIMDLLITQRENYIEKLHEKECDQATIEVKEFLPMFEYVANNGNVDLQFKLGCAYENINFGQDYSKSVKWYSMAMKYSHTEATYRLGVLYEYGLGVTQNYERAIRLYSTVEEKGHVKAAYRLGNIYHSGSGAKKDLEIALRYYTKASKQGNSDAQYELASIYVTENGEVKDILKALEWYTKSYLKGQDKARYPLYSLYDDNNCYEDFFHDKIATTLLKYTRNKNNYLGGETYVDPNLYLRLGEMYLIGQGIQKNQSKAWASFKATISILITFYSNFGEYMCKFIKKNALELYKIATKESRNGDTWAHVLLGLMYLGGIALIDDCEEDNKRIYSTIFDDYVDLDSNKSVDESGSTSSIIVPRDFKRAHKYFLKAAKDGNGYSKVMVGQMLHCGYGVKQDFAKAMEYYQSAPEGTCVYIHFARSCIYLLHLFDDGVKKNYEKNMEYITVFGTTSTDYYNIAQMYYYGDSVEQNYKAAINLLLHASSFRVVDGGLEVIRRFSHSTSTKSITSKQHKYSIVSSKVVHGKIEYQLGIMYEKEQGTITSHADASERFSKSATYGNKEAQEHLDLFYKNGSFIGKKLDI